MGILLAIVLGAFIGWIASIITKNDYRMGWFGNIVVGIVGAFVGNLIGGAFGSGATITEFSLVGLFWSLVGAVVVLLIVNLLTKKKLVP
jgi:uncharacterized membrane protein YeaQ/YmgE (transglycosylase-associated protein family)